MSIQRLHVGPRLSEAAIHNGVVYLAGQVADDSSLDITGQTQQVRNGKGKHDCYPVSGKQTAETRDDEIHRPRGFFERHKNDEAADDEEEVDAVVAKRKRKRRRRIDNEELREAGSVME